jgi:hypothetical protein
MDALHIGTVGVLVGVAVIVTGLIRDIWRIRGPRSLSSDGGPEGSSTAVPANPLPDVAHETEDTAYSDWRRIVGEVKELSRDELETLKAVGPHEVVDLVREGRRRAKLRRQLVDVALTSRWLPPGG